MIATWIYLDTEQTSSFFPQVGARSNSTKVQAIYWRCVACFYALSVRLNPEESHLLYTNAPVPEDLDGLPLATLLKELRVEVRTLPLTYRVPDTWSKSFRNQFYLFDILHDFAERGRSEDWLCVLDSDCVFVRNVAPLRTVVECEGAATYLCLKTTETEPMNGLRESEMARLGPALGLRLPHDRVRYAGGEFFGTTANAARRIDALSRGVFDALTEMNRRNPGFYCDEAHMLSMICEHLGLNNGFANPFVRRIWTQFQHQNALPSDLDLAIWHVPAEKKYGYLDLFESLRREGVTFAGGRSDDALRAGVARTMGIPTMSLAKKAKDLRRGLGYRIAKRLARP